jgi:hypothetical protein
MPKNQAVLDPMLYRYQMSVPRMLLPVSLAPPVPDALDGPGKAAALDASVVSADAKQFSVGIYLTFLECQTDEDVLQGLATRT